MLQLITTNIVLPEMQFFKKPGHRGDPLEDFAFQDIFIRRVGAR